MNETRLLTVSEVAEYLAVNPGWVYRQSEEGKIPVIKCGKYNRYNLAAVLLALGNGDND